MDQVEITVLLERMRAGNDSARAELFSRVYNELRSIARMRLRKFPADSIGATELVNELYPRLFGRSALTFEDRRHFFRLVARAMQRVLIDRARRRSAEKRGGGVDVRSLDDAVEAAERSPREFLTLGRAISRLGKVNPLGAEIVRLRFFVGLTGEEIAETLRKSPATIDRGWKYARAWLYAELGKDAE